MGAVITVSGAVGGIGTSSLAYAIALQRAQRSLLIDAQPTGAPLDLLIGAESVPGTRWHQIHVASAAIDADTIMSALPQHHGVTVLSSSRQGVVQPMALTHLVDATRDVCELVVVDIAARSAVIELLRPDLQIVAVPSTILGIGAAIGVIADDVEFVVMRAAAEDFLPKTMSGYLPNPCVGVVECERAVWLAMRSRIPFPAKCSLMQVARRIVDRVGDAA